MTIHFHDVSHFQSNYQPIGPTFAKATEGTGYADTGYAQTKARTIAGGWPFAAYHFLHHGSIQAQAEWAYRHIGNTPTMLDVERPKSGADPTLSDVTGFVDAYRKLGGVLHLVYLPHWYWVEIGSPSLQPLIDRGCALISSSYSAYSDTGPGWAPYGGMTPAIWQYTDSPIDTNAFKGTVAEMAALIEGADMAMTSADVRTNYQTDGILKNYAWRPDATSNPTITPESLIHEAGDEAHAAHVQAQANGAILAGIVKTEAALTQTLNTIAAAVTSGVPVDTVALAADIKAVGDAESAAVAALSAQLTTAQQTITGLQARLAAGAAAESAALAK